MTDCPVILDPAYRQSQAEDATAPWKRRLPHGSPLQQYRHVPTTRQLVCRATCLLSGYSPLGHNLIGMRSRRGAKDQYLARPVQSGLLVRPGHRGSPRGLPSR